MKEFRNWVDRIGGKYEAAKLLKVTPDAVRHWLSGHASPNFRNLQKIQKLSRIPMKDLLSIKY